MTEAQDEEAEEAGGLMREPEGVGLAPGIRNLNGCLKVAFLSGVLAALVLFIAAYYSGEAPLEQTGQKKPVILNLIDTIKNLATEKPPLVAAVGPAPEMAWDMPAWMFVIQDRLLAFSAHWDGRPLYGHAPPYVRILAYSMEWRVSGRGSPTMYDAQNVTCTFMYADDSTKDVPAEFLHIGTGQNLEHFAIICPTNGTLASSPEGAPASVKLNCPACETRWSLEISNRDALRSDVAPRGKLAVCVKPGYGPYSTPLTLVQFLSYYTLLGVEHFTVYGTGGWSPLMVSLFKAAQAVAVPIEHVPWDFFYTEAAPYRSYEGEQFVFTNDCLLRHLNRYANVAIVDLDELITPRGNEEKSLLRVIETLDRQHPNASDYSFANHFFFTHMQGVNGSALNLTTAEAPPTAALPFDMFTAVTRHEPFANGNRSKCVIKPARVVVATTHSVTHRVPGAETVHVSPDVGSLFHYRVGNDTKGSSENRVRDYEMFKYTEGMASSPVTQALLPLARRKKGGA